MCRQMGRMGTTIELSVIGLVGGATTFHQTGILLLFLAGAGGAVLLFILVGNIVQDIFRIGERYGHVKPGGNERSGHHVAPTRSLDTTRTHPNRGKNKGSIRIQAYLRNARSQYHVGHGPTRKKRI